MDWVVTMFLFLFFVISQSTEFVKKNIVITSGFVGGFLLGLASQDLQNDKSPGFIDVMENTEEVIAGWFLSV